MELILLAVSIGFFYWLIAGASPKYLKLNNMLRRLPKHEKGFDPTHYLFNLSSSSNIAPSAIAIYHDLQQICIFRGNLRSNSIDKKYLDYKDIIGVDLIKDGETITSTSRSGQVLGVAVGGLLLGEAGAIIGGLSPKNTSINKIKLIALSIKISDISNPSVYFPIKDNYIQLGILGAKGNVTVSTEAALSTAEKWFDIFKLIIRDSESKNKEDGKPNDLNLSVVDKILQLTELNKNGSITNEEFSRAKSILLANVDNGEFN